MSLSQPALLQCRTRSQLAVLLDIEVSGLTYYAYAKDRGKKYKHFQIPKKSGGTRVISAPVGGLSAIQKKLAVLLDEVYVRHPAAHGFIAKRSILSNALPHLNRQCVLNIDLEDFFPSITATRIIGLLKSKPFGLSPVVASTIAALCTYNDRLPQGAPTSPIISNMICYRLDRELMAVCRKERATYTRYADDITFSTTQIEFSETFISLETEKNIILGERLKVIVESNYFNINQNKVRLRKGAQSKFVTGVKVNLKPNLSRGYVRELRSMLHSWEHFELEGAQSEFDNKYNGRGRSFKNVVLGKIAHLKQIKGQEDLVYRKLFNRAMILQGKYDQVLPVSRIEDLQNRIFVIKSGTQYGTGFILDRKWLVTCAHVLTAEEEVKFFPFNKFMFPEEYNVTRKARSWISSVNEFDLAVMPIDDKLINDANALESAPPRTEVKTEDECAIIGFPNYYLGATPSLIDVKVIKVERNKYDIKDAYVDRTLVTGNSGGPVLNSRNQLIGIVRTGAPDKNNQQGLGSTFLPIQEIRRCLSAFNLPE